MKRLALVALLLVACTPKPPPDPAIAAELAEFDARYEKLRTESLQSLRQQVPKTSRDFRGRTVDQDTEQWVFAPEARKRIEAARESVTSLRGDPAYTALRAADLLVKAEVDRAAQISLYWDGARPGLYWRDYWQAFFEANDAPTPAPDARLLDQEEHARAALEVGDFSRANAEASRLATVLRESLSAAARRFPSRDQPAALKYVVRKAPCGPAIQPIPWQDKAKYVGGEAIESFYPPVAIGRGEEGGVVLRLRIARTGCVTAAAVVVHSGVPALDSAALQWFESSQFAPASSDGRAIDSELSLRVVFRLEDSEPTK